MHVKLPGLPVPRGQRATRFVTTQLCTASPRALFIEGYPSFAAMCRAVDEPGLAVIAMDDATGAVIGNCGLRPCVGRPAIATLGRHERCEIPLWHDGIALRHLAIVIDPLTSYKRGAGVPYRVFDLRTTLGLADETGRELRGFRAEGPAIVRCGGHTIFMLPLGDPSDWPEAAADAWEMLPERVYLDERASASPRSRKASLIFRIPALRTTTDQLPDEPVAHLEVRQQRRTNVIGIGHTALQNGVLIGRYGRCDLPASEDASLSRVHALLLEVAGRHVIADLSSTYGLGPIGGDRARVVALIDGTQLLLGTSTQLTWRCQT